MKTGRKGMDGKERETSGLRGQMTAKKCYDQTLGG